MKKLKFEDVLNEQLKDQEFKKEREDSKQEYDITKATIRAGINQNISQVEPAKKSA